MEKKDEKRERDEKELRQFQKWFKQLGMTLEEAYDQFMGELEEQEDDLILAAQCSDCLKLNIPPKQKDPGRFTVQCCFGKVQERALCDLGSSISLMPLSFARKWKIGKLTTLESMEIILADQSILKPSGEITDVLVKIKDLAFAV
ncbi:hypothetical protein A2U01_0043562, partial [Trifolium medium]|nr:hypothetical protein [Trifolium medium]